MGSGWITTNRDVRDHWIWKKSTVKTYYEAWTDMIMSASTKPNKQVIQDNLIKTDRGQVAWSISYMAKRWGWSTQNVRTFVKKLTQDEMIFQHRANTATNTGITIITICNYKKYQDIKKRTNIATEQKLTQSQHNDQHNANTTPTTIEPLQPLQPLKNKTAQTKTGRFDDFWKPYPNKVNKKKAKAIWQSRKLDNLADLIIADIHNRTANDDNWLKGYIPMPTTYLNGDRWEDAIKAPRQKKTGSAASQERNDIALEKINEKIRESRNERARITTSGSHGTALATTDPILW